MLTRTFDAAHINAVLNHPSVFVWSASVGVEKFDMTSVAADASNIFLVNEHGGFIFVPVGKDVYEVHTQFLKSGSHSVLRSAREAADYIFQNTPCEKIVTEVPTGNVRAKKLTIAMGFDLKDKEDEWTYLDGRTVKAEWFELTREKWQCQQQL